MTIKLSITIFTHRFSERCQRFPIDSPVAMTIHILVGGVPTPLENMSSSFGMIPHYVRNKSTLYILCKSLNTHTHSKYIEKQKCPKPPNHRFTKKKLPSDSPIEMTITLWSLGHRPWGAWPSLGLALGGSGMAQAGGLGLTWAEMVNQWDCYHQGIIYGIYHQTSTTFLWLYNYIIYVMGSSMVYLSMGRTKQQCDVWVPSLCIPC